MSEFRPELDIIKLVREVSEQGVKDFEFEFGKLKIKMSSGKSVTSGPVAPDFQETIPSASASQIAEMEAQEEKTVAERVKERDESLLSDIDYISPELAGDLQRANIIKVGDNGQYEYVEEEGLDA